MRNPLAQVNTQGTFAQHVSGPLAGIGMLCLMLAKNWAVLSIGWAVLAFLIIAGVVQRFRRTPMAGQPLFELGPLIWADLEKINRWIRPVAVFVLLLGLAGVLVSFGDEGPGHPGYAIFLIGTGVACLGIGKANRPLIIAGYALWTIAGAIVCYAALSIESSLASAQAITLGALLFFGGGFAVYGFLYGRTKIYEEGILLSNGICPWHCIDAWTVTSVSDTPHLQITIGKWRPLMGVRPDQAADLEEFLSQKWQEKDEHGHGTSAIIARLTSGS
jgi:hypothetical protein